MKIKGIIFLVLFFLNQLVWGQNTVAISFQAVFRNSPIQIETESYQLSGKDSVRFSSIKFYISKIELLKDQKSIWKEPNSFHLVDIENPETSNIKLQSNQNQSFNEIKFTLGIDSITNVSGALGGDLDPTEGMYWTWDNGYINVKIEGNSKLCKTRNNEFKFHIGGYKMEVNTARAITLSTENQKDIKVLLDLNEVLKGIDLTKTNQIMSAGEEGVRISDLLAKSFTIKN
jgi:hypothetical protein